jgi:hypothetical protein
MEQHLAQGRANSAFRYSLQLNCGNAYYHSAHDTLSSHLLSKILKIRIYTTKILSEFSYGCETWSLPVREEHKLRVFENRALRRIFGPQRDVVTGGWIKLHKEKLHDIYSPPSIIRIINSWWMR